MLLFNKIEGGVAIVRKPKGYLAQLELYSRGKQVYLKVNNSFLRIADKLGDSYLTVSPDYKVLELEGEGVNLYGNKPPYYETKGWVK